MSSPTIQELLKDAQREFCAVLGGAVETKSCETFAESSYRGGFRLVFAGQGGQLDVLYSDMQLEISFRGTEVFGINLHAGFEGNMFSREHLKEYLPRIAASVANGVQANHANC